MKNYNVPFNKHKYQDISDIPKPANKIIQAESPEDAGLIMSKFRDDTDIDGIRTKQGNRYYIGLIHWQNIEVK